MNSDLPYIKSTENRFYLQSNPAIQKTIRGNMAATVDQAQVLPTKIGINRTYVTDLKTGLLRLILIIFLTCGWISAAAVAKNPDLLNNYGEFASARTAYLFFSLLAFLLYLIIYMLNLLNITRMDKFRGIPWNLINFVLDVFFLVTMFSCSVAAAVRESQLNNSSDVILRSITNRGAFGSAAAFGFMSVIVLIICVAFWVMYLKKNPTEKSTTGPGGPSMPNATASSGINQMTKSTSQPQFKTFSSEDRTENI